MNKEEVLQFLNANTAFSIATSDGNIPHVRTLLLHKADETGIYFMVGKFKASVAKQALFGTLIIQN